MPESILRTILITLLVATGTVAQSKEPAEVSAARACAEGLRLYEQKKYSEAEARFLEGIAESERDTKSTTVRGGCLVQLALTQQKKKQHIEAESSARRAVAIFERFPLSGNLGLGSALIVLGETLEDSGKYPEAAAVVERAWNLQIGKDSDQATQYQGIPFRQRLGRIYLKNKEYERAAEILQQNVLLLEKPRITGHTEVVPALNELAAVYIAQGKWGEAEDLLYRALTLLDRWPEEVWAEELLATLDEYAELMRLSGSASKAKSFADRAKAIRDHYPDDLE